MLERERKTFWSYGQYKLHEIGLRGVFAGYSLSLCKETLTYGVFFSSFEFVKQQAYYSYLVHYYGHRYLRLFSDDPDPHRRTTRIKPHWALEPMFLLAAGATASTLSQ